MPSNTSRALASTPPSGKKVAKRKGKGIKREDEKNKQGNTLLSSMSLKGMNQRRGAGQCKTASCTSFRGDGLAAWRAKTQCIQTIGPRHIKTTHRVTQGTHSHLQTVSGLIENMFANTEHGTFATKRRVREDRGRLVEGQRCGSFFPKTSSMFGFSFSIRNRGVGASRSAGICGR